jgi:hypothetical protein
MVEGMAVADQGEGLSRRIGREYLPAPQKLKSDRLKPWPAAVFSAP